LPFSVSTPRRPDPPSRLSSDETRFAPVGVRLIAVLSVVGLAIALASIGLLYNVADRQQGLRLQDMAQSHARMIEAIAAHEERWTHAASLPAEQGDVYQTVLYQSREAQQGFGSFERTGELEVGRHEGDSIVYLVARRGDSVVNPASVPFGGRILVEATQEDGFVRVRIADTGEGIGPEHMSRLFEPLFSTRTFGVGLGLPIAKSYVEANGGTIGVESEPDKGSTFTVTLPTA